MAEMKLSELADQLGGELTGDGEPIVRGVGPIESARADEVSFLTNEKYKRHVASSHAAAVIVGADYDGPGESLIRCEDAYFAFRQAMMAFYGFREPTFDGIDDRASVAPTASVADNVRIGPFVTVSDGAQIGAGTTLHPGAFIGPRVRIGQDCTIHPNVTICDDCKLGDRVILHANTCLGQDGFGYATHDGVHAKIPQAGIVELEDDVEIGAGCAIDRATFGSTVIGAGTKLGSNITIGHGVKMGKHCLVIAQAGIAGSTTAGDYVVFAAQCGVVGHINIGDGVRIGAQSGVVSDIPPGEEVLGTPHVPLSLMRRIYATFTKLPEMRMAIKKLTRTVNSMLKADRESGRGAKRRESR